MRQKIKVRKQRVIVNSIRPIEIDENYKFIRDDFAFLILSKVVYFFCALILGGIFFKLICTHKILGKKKINVLKRIGFISVSNHCHYLDGVLTGSALGPRIIWYPSVQRNFETPYLRRFLRILKGFPIPRGPFGLMHIIKPCVQAINKGDIIHFYPESELWHLHQEIGNFQQGAFYMAHVTNCPIVPIVHLFKPKTFFGKKLSSEILTITSVIGDPIYPDNPCDLINKYVDMESVKIMTNKAHDWMESEMFKYKKENNLF